MKIDRIEVYHVAMPLLKPWRTSYGEDADIHSVIVRMISGDAEGWGEASPFAAPCYSPEWAGGAFAVIQHWLAPTLIGAEISSGSELQAKLFAFKRNSFAKSALDNAWWSLAAQISQTPLHELLGATRTTVPVGADFGVCDHVDELLTQVASAVDAGFPRIKLKFAPGWDVPVLEAVRDQFPTHPIHIDCNGAYTIDDLPLFQRIDDFHLEMIEQPLQHDDLIDHAKLQAQIKTPVCLDESVVHLRSAQQAIDLKSCQFVNIKPGRVGGLTVAKQIHDHCQAVGVPCWVGSMLESATGAAHLIALAMLDNFTYPADIFPSSRFYANDMSGPPIQLDSDETLPCPSISVVDPLPIPDRDQLEQLTVQSIVLD
ncbi:MAG: o-succinylbenzoate synthase [Planctomycetaceae bacterium]|nr:o-succinylbenzoate synthase [Planctomycetaceae bacterium]